MYGFSGEKHDARVGSGDDGLAIDGVGHFAADDTVFLVVLQMVVRWDLEQRLIKAPLDRAFYAPFRTSREELSGTDQREDPSLAHAQHLAVAYFHQLLALAFA